MDGDSYEYDDREEGEYDDHDMDEYEKHSGPDTDDYEVDMPPLRDQPKGSTEKGDEDDGDRFGVEQIVSDREEQPDE